MITNITFYTLFISKTRSILQRKFEQKFKNYPKLKTSLLQLEIYNFQIRYSETLVIFG